MHSRIMSLRVVLTLFAIPETWFKDIDTAHKIDLTPPGLKLFDHARSQRAGGGTALILRDSFLVTKVSAHELNSFEF